MTDKPQSLRLEYMDAEQLAENPSNWRTHSDHQLKAIEDVIGEVGWAGALLYNERTGRLIDGHARKKISKGKVPVLIGSWSEEDEKVILATFDPLGAAAEADPEKLAALLAEIETGSEALETMLGELAAENGIGDPNPNDPEAEWRGMPEFDQQNIMGDALTCLVRFQSENDRTAFENLLGYKLSHKGKTYTTWFPKAEFDQLGTKGGLVYDEP